MNTLDLYIWYNGDHVTNNILFVFHLFLRANKIVRLKNLCGKRTHQNDKHVT